MAFFEPPPYRSPVLEKSGILNWPWLKWFQKFFTDITNAVDNGTLEAFDWQTAKDWAPDIAQSFQALSDVPRSYDQPIADLALAGAFGADLASPVLQRLEALESLVSSLREYNGELQQQVSDLQHLAACADPIRPPQLYSIQDLIANQVNYPAAGFPNVFFYATDTNNLYLSDGTNWNLTT